MSVLSVTFHVESTVQPQWYDFLEKEFPALVENLYDVEKFIFSEVDSDYIQEGKRFQMRYFLIWIRKQLTFRITSTTLYRNQKCFLQEYQLFW